MTRPRHTGSLRLRRNVWWARFYHHGTLVEVSTKETDKAKAAKVLRTKLRTADTPQFIPPAAEKLRFEDLCDLLRRDYARKGNRSRLGPRLAPLSTRFAGELVLAITTPVIDAYGDDRIAQGAKPATVNRELAALRRGFRLSVRDGRLPTMPAFTLRPEDNVREGFLDPPDFAAFVAALRPDAPALADAAEFAYWTALRRGNVFGALWPWFQLEVEADRVMAGHLRIPGAVMKQKKTLNLPLTGALLALIDRRWQQRLATSPYVFHRAGRRLQELGAPWHRAAAAIGRRGLLFHDLRRSAARTLRRAGVDEATIMRLGGWKTRAMFARYSIVDDQDLVEAQAKLEAIFRAPAARKTAALRRPTR